MWVIEVLLREQASTCHGSGVMTDGQQIESIWCLEQSVGPAGKARTPQEIPYSCFFYGKQTGSDICPGYSEVSFVLPHHLWFSGMRTSSRKKNEKRETDKNNKTQPKTTKFIDCK